MGRLTHVLEHKVNVSVVVSLENVAQSDNVVVPGHFLEVHNLTERPLCICRILEGVEDFLQRNHFLRALVDGLPHNSVCLKENKG